MRVYSDRLQSIGDAREVAGVHEVQQNRLVFRNLGEDWAKRGECVRVSRKAALLHSQESRGRLGESEAR